MSNVTTSLDGEKLIIKVVGDFSDFSENEFSNSYEQVKPKPKQIIIDLQKVDYINSLALGQFIILRAYADKSGVDLNLINCNEDVKQILRITKMDTLLKIS